jgi:hypothetical protein
MVTTRTFCPSRERWKEVRLNTSHLEELLMGALKSRHTSRHTTISRSEKNEEMVPKPPNLLLFRGGSPRNRALNLRIKSPQFRTSSVSRFRRAIASLWVVDFTFSSPDDVGTVLANGREYVLGNPALELDHGGVASLSAEDELVEPRLREDVIGAPVRPLRTSKGGFVRGVEQHHSQ